MLKLEESNNNSIEERINLIRMMYPDINSINEQVYYYRSGNDIVFVDLNLNTLMSMDADTTKIEERFILESKPGCIVSVHTFIGEKLISKDIKHSSIHNALVICNEYLVSTSYYIVTILDSLLNVIDEIKDIFNLRVSGVTSEKLFLSYRDTLYNAIISNIENIMCINRKTSTVEYYALEDFTYGDEFITRAYVMHEAGEGFNYDKVALYKNGKVISKPHKLIEKGVELNGTRYYYTYDDYEEGSLRVGIISENGEEISDTVNGNIRYIGNDYFIVDNRKLCRVTNNKLGCVIESMYDITHIDHLYLWVIVDKNDRCTYLFGVRTGLFKSGDIAKNMKCWYNKSNPSILKIHTGISIAYTDNRLNEIKDSEYLDNTEDTDWVQMI